MDLGAAQGSRVSVICIVKYERSEVVLLVSVISWMEFVSRC